MEYDKLENDKKRNKEYKKKGNIYKKKIVKMQGNLYALKINLNSNNDKIRNLLN